MASHIWMVICRSRVAPWTMKLSSCIFSETIASFHFTPLYARLTWKSCRSLGFSQPSTRWLALDFTSCYRFTPNYTHLTRRNVIPTFGNHQSNSKIAFICLYLTSNSGKLGLVWINAILSTVNLNTRVTNGIPSLFYIPTSFVNIRPIRMHTTSIHLVLETKATQHCLLHVSSLAVHKYLIETSNRRCIYSFLLYQHLGVIAGSL